MNKKRLLSSVLLVSILTVNVKANHYNFDKVTILEEDESDVKTTSYQYEVVNVLSTKFNGDVKLELGLGESKKLGANVGVEATSSNTKKEIRTATITRKEESDNLGSVKIYFYDPIIESKTSATQYQVRTYNTGNVKFGISAY